MYYIIYHSKLILFVYFRRWIENQLVEQPGWTTFLRNYLCLHSCYRTLQESMQKVLMLTYFFAPLGKCVPSARSNFPKICGFGIAPPLSYCWMICGRSFMALAKSDCVIFFAKRAAVIALLKDLSTVACLNSSVESSNFFKFAPPPECALLFSAAPNLRSVTSVPATLA